MGRCDHCDYCEEDVFCMLVKTKKIVLKALERLAEPHGLSDSRWFVLYLLSKKDNQIQKDLARQLEQEQSFMTRLIDGLEQRNLVERKRNPDDRRSFCISITEEGKKAFEKGKVLYEEFKDTILGGFQPEEHDQLLNYLYRLRKNADVYNQ